MNLRVLITGSKGFLGSRLVMKLSHDRSLSLIGVDKEKEDSNGEKIRNYSFIYCDLSEKDQVNNLFKETKIDAVIHTAAVISNKNDTAYLELAVKNNLIPQMNLISAALENGCKKYIYCSTISVYDFKRNKIVSYKENAHMGPSTLYGWSKLSAEDILKIMTNAQETMIGVTLRFSGIHGVGRASGVIFQMILSALYDKTIKVDEPDSQFRFIFIDDAIEAVSIALKNKASKKYSCYNVGGKEIYTLKELAVKIKKLTRSKSEIVFAKAKIKRNQVLDISAIMRELKFAPNTLEKNLKNMIDYMRENYYGKRQ